jgi:hypothetical protein
MLEVTIALELVLGKWLEAAIVAAALVRNAAFALAQEGPHATQNTSVATPVRLAR